MSTPPINTPHGVWYCLPFAIKGAPKTVEEKNGDFRTVSRCTPETVQDRDIVTMEG